MLPVAVKRQSSRISELERWQSIGRVLEVDQTPIGKTPRSCPATYVGIFDQIRKLFAATPEARLRGYDASRFSFNAPGVVARCEGQGLKRIEMSFLPDVRVNCERAAAAASTPRRWPFVPRQEDRRRVEDDRRRSRRVLRGPAEDPPPARAPARGRPGLPRTRSAEPDVVRRRGAAREARDGAREGPTGEPARRPAPTLYVLEEPTIGLHIADVEKLVRVLHRLVDAGNTVIVIEHNLDVMAEADWLIDLGPEGGDGGGRVVAQGPPEKVARGRSHTAHALRAFLATRSVTSAA